MASRLVCLHTKSGTIRPPLMSLQESLPLQSRKSMNGTIPFIKHTHVFKGLDSVFLIKEGEYKVSIPFDFKMSDNFLSFLKPGELFGEMGVITGNRRAANITCTADTQLLVMREVEVFLSPESAVGDAPSLADKGEQRAAQGKRKRGSFPEPPRIARRGRGHGPESVSQTFHALRIPMTMTYDHLNVWFDTGRERLMVPVAITGTDNFCPFEPSHIHRFSEDRKVQLRGIPGPRPAARDAQQA